MAYLAFTSVGDSDYLSRTGTATIDGSASVDVDIYIARASGQFRYTTANGGGTGSMSAGTLTVRLLRGSTLVSSQVVTSYLNTCSGTAPTVAQANAAGHNISNFSSSPNGYSTSFDFDAVAGSTYRIQLVGTNGLCGDDVVAWDTIASFASASWSMPTAQLRITPTSATLNVYDSASFEMYMDPSGTPSNPRWSLSPTTYASLGSSSGLYTDVTNNNETYTQRTTTLTATASSQSRTATVTLRAMPDIYIDGYNTIRYNEEEEYTCYRESNGAHISSGISWGGLSSSAYYEYTRDGAYVYIYNINDTTSDRTVNLTATHGTYGSASKRITLQRPMLTGIRLVSYTDPLTIHTGTNGFQGTIVVEPQPAGLTPSVTFTAVSSNTSYLTTGSATSIGGGQWSIPTYGLINCYDNTVCPTVNVTVALASNPSTNFSVRTGNIHIRPNTRVFDGSFRRGWPSIFDGSFRESVEVYTFDGSWRRNYVV